MLNSKKLFYAPVLFICLSLNAFAGGIKEEAVVLTSNNLKLEVYESTGSFCLYKILDNKIADKKPESKYKSIALYDDRAMGSTNYYTMRFNDRAYKLRKGFGKTVTVENLGDAVSIRFDISENFTVRQILSFTENYYDTSAPLLKITTTITNNTEEPVPVALKALFDTILGEQRRVSLYTDTQNAIFSETRINPVQAKDTYIVSANPSVACLFFIKNAEQTTPEDIYIENREYLQTDRWVPRYIVGRSFSTKNYTNDSAITMLWSEKEINPEESYTVTNVIGVNDFLQVNEELSQEVVEQHLETLTVEERKNYDHVLELIEELNKVQENSEDYTDENLLDLIERIEAAMKELQE
ncbi:MAG: hypothetical protein CR988_02615 [Treponema sp.]|nr:MAG: hypothetical protein CR988_02615 [Treponema sp.]